MGSKGISFGDGCHLSHVAGCFLPGLRLADHSLQSSIGACLPYVKAVITSLFDNLFSIERMEIADHLMEA
jgi:hypothetical protein